MNHTPHLTGHLPDTQTVYQPQPIVITDPVGDPRRALVQLDTGEWVLARVPPAPPVIVPAAPEAAPRRPLTALERGAIITVSSICALTLSAGGALAMAGPYLASLASLAFGTAALLGTGVAGWLALRLTGAVRASTSSSGQAPAVTNHITNNVTVRNIGMLSRGHATGIGKVGRIG